MPIELCKKPDNKNQTPVRLIPCSDPMEPALRNRRVQKELHEKRRHNR